VNRVKKWLVMLLMLLLVAGTASFALADDTASSTTPKFRGHQKFDLTEEQKNELSAYYSQIAEIQKQIRQKLVEYGKITPEQLQQMEERKAQMKEKMESGEFPGKRGLRGKPGGRMQPPAKTQEQAS